MRLSGSWPAVAKHPEGWAGVYLSGSELVSFVNEPGNEVWRTDVGAIRFTDTATVGGVIHTVMAREQGGKDHGLYVIGDEVADLGQCYGMRPIAIENVDGELISFMVLPGGTQYRRFNLTAGGHSDFDIGITAGTVAGILQIWHGWPDFDELTEPLLAGGFRFEHHVDLDSTTFVGQSDDDGDGVIAAHSGNVYTVIPGQGREPKGVRLDDGRYVFCARVGNEACFAVCPPWPDVLVMESNPITIPTFRPANRAIGVGYFFDDSGEATIPGALGVQSPVAFDTRDPNDLDVAGMKLVQEWAKNAYVPYGLYIDRYGFRPELVPAAGRAMLFTYPSAGVPVRETLQKATADILTCKAAGVPFDLVAATYCQYRSPGVYALTEQQVLETLGAVWELALEHGAGALWCFAKTRKHNGVVVDGADYWPNIAEAVKRMRAASQDYRSFPQLSASDIPEKPNAGAGGTQPTPTIPISHEEPMSAPSFDQWIKQEYPRVVEAWRFGQTKGPNDNPGHEWAAFTTVRRYSEWIGNGEKWSVERLIENERAQRQNPQ